MSGPPPNYTIIPMKIEHVPAVLKIWQATKGLILTDTDNEVDLAHYFDRNPGLSQVAVVNDAVIAAVLCGHDGRRGYLHHLAVAQEYQSHGIGRQLVHFGLRKLNEAGIRQCNLFIIDDHATGRQFWNKDGWSEWKNIRLMSKILTDLP